MVRPSVQRLLSLMVLLPALTALPEAVAQEVDGGTVWLCGLSANLTRVVCVADVDPATDLDTAAAVPTAQVNGTRFPLDRRGRWTVDLWSPATDPESVTLLARATICYRSPGCNVVMTLPELTSNATSQHRRR
jgi:hypothetical protein